MIPAIWNYLVGYAAGTAIAVIGLYIAFVIPVYLRWRLGDKDEPRAWSLGKHYKWIDPRVLPWVALITIIFMIPLYKVGLPWEDDFDWGFTNYTILWFAGIGLFFGGWWVLSARHWFKGPVRMGTEEELERMEEEQLGSSSCRPRHPRRRVRGQAPVGGPRPPAPPRTQAPSPFAAAARSAPPRSRRSRSRARTRPTARRPTSPRGSRT